VLVFLLFAVLLVPVVAQSGSLPSQAVTVSQTVQRRDSDPILDDRLSAAAWVELLRRLPVRLWLPWGGWWPGR
jgi:hypothetical protein